MELRDINVNQRGTVESHVYENLTLKPEKQDDTQTIGGVNTDEGIYEQLTLNRKQNKTNGKIEDDQSKRLKWLMNILCAMIIVLYIAVIVITIVVVVVTRTPESVDGKWTNWSEWTACDVTCGNGTQIRTRACANPSPSFGGKNCVGDSIQNDRCMKEDCPVTKGGWSNWGSWSTCSSTCGEGGTKARGRSCTNPKPSDLGEYCDGDPFQLQQCSLSICSDPVDGKWTNWSGWTACDVSCGNGTQIRTRACANPFPSLGGAYCVGENIQSERCMKGTCPVKDGGWTDWEGWSVCSVTCGGGGTKARSRSCTNPKPSELGEYCVGDPFQLQQCNQSICSEKDGGWTNWGSWSVCSVSCGEGGTKARSRSCTNPKPSDLGEYCGGDPFQLQLCSLSICSIDGNWTNWSEWTACDITCGNGTQIRTRACANPSPSIGGANCVGESIHNSRCIRDTCPGRDGGWTDWESWSVCSVTCGGGGTKARSRSCTNPKPSDQGEYCAGDPFQLQQCNLSICSGRDGGWTNWGNWSTCSVTCGGGSTQARSRSCTNPKPSDLGKYCDGDPFQLQQCNLSICSGKDGGWTNWGSWSVCSVTCGGGGSKARSRSCTNPKPADLGEYCAGDPFQLQQCNQSICSARDGGWTNWGSWSACSVTCGGGTKARSRSCTNPKASDTGENCNGDPFKLQQCSYSTCSSKMSAFSVDQPNSYRSVYGVNKLTFSHQIYQNGRDFSLSYGTYTCSISGTYHFSVTLVKKRASSRVDWVYCDLYKSGNSLIKIKVDPTDDATDNGHAAISQSVVTHLNVGNTVYLSGCTDPPSDYMEEWSSFTGFLLYPDN